MSWALGPFLQSEKHIWAHDVCGSSAEAPRKVRGRSAEARRSTLDPYPCLSFRNPFFSPMGNPNELLLVRPHVAATWQLHSYGNDLLSLWPRVASKSQLDLHENLCMNVTAFLKTCHPSAGIFCMCTHNIIYACSSCNLPLYLPKTKESTEKSMRRNLCRSLRSPFAEADPETQPKNLRGSSRGRRKQKRLQAILAQGSRKGLRGRVVSVMKLPKNKNQNSYAK